MTKSYSQILGQPITFPNGVTAPNRFLKSAMTERLCTYSDDNESERGKPTPEYIRLYEEWGRGEIGTIVLGNIPVKRDGLEAKKNAVIDADSEWDAVEAFKPVIAATKREGMLCIGQLTHGGRQVSEDIVKTPVSSSDIPNPPAMGMTFGKPRPLEESEIEDLIERWAHAAEVLYKAGADGAQLHGAHGYLLSQFLSSRVNKRTDKWGGELENKSRIVFRIIEAINARVDRSKFLISIKLNSADFSDGGFTEDESTRVCKDLDAAGVDLIELSGGTYESLPGGFEHKRESTKKREAYFVEFAESIRPHIKNAVLAVTGGFRTAQGMAEAIEGGSTQIVGLARPLTAEPRLCKEILAGQKDAAKPNAVPNAIQTGTSIMQIGAIGAGKDIPDLSQEKVATHLVDVMMGKAPAEDKPHEDQETASYEK